MRTVNRENGFTVETNQGSFASASLVIATGGLSIAPLGGMIQRLPNTQCYHVTDAGFRAALFFTRTYNRLLRPGLAAALPDHRATPTRLKRAFDKIDTCLTASINELALAA